MFKKEGALSKIIGIVLLVIIIVVVVILKNKDTLNPDTSAQLVYGAVGGGKEDLLADEDIKKIFAEKYGIEMVSDTWSNGKTVRVPVVRDDGSDYDYIFFSDARYYEYYKTPATGEEATRRTVEAGEYMLNTPIVIYSWDKVVDALINEKIVTIDDKTGVYYITDMPKLIDYILDGKQWKDIGLDSIYGPINIGSVDPVSSSPGATYYGLLLSIMAGGEVNDDSFEKALPKLKQFYLKSGYMNNTPADLFSMFLKTGMGAKPMIVDYEKSVVDFANSNPDGWKQVKDKIRILYPTPTIWNSHCIAAFDEEGKTVIKAFEDQDVSKIAWEKYGFRVGVSGGTYNTDVLKITGIPQEIEKVTPGLKMDYYNRLVSYLSQK